MNLFESNVHSLHMKVLPKWKNKPKATRKNSYQTFRAKSFLIGNPYQNKIVRKNKRKSTLNNFQLAVRSKV